MTDLKARWTFSIAVVLAAVLIGCGDGGTTATPTPTTTTVFPAADLNVSGNGAIAVHPSLDTRFGAAIVFPITVEETAGGRATWNYFRVSYFRNGVEIERNEQGADEIERAGYRNIGARATLTAEVITRVNATDWDDVQIRLGFTDTRDAREFERFLSLESFDTVVLDFTPLFLPEGSELAIVER